MNFLAGEHLESFLQQRLLPKINFRFFFLFHKHKCDRSELRLNRDPRNIGSLDESGLSVFGFSYGDEGNRDVFVHLWERMNAVQTLLNGLFEAFHFLLDHFASPRNHLCGDRLAIKQYHTSFAVEEAADLLLNSWKQFVELGNVPR